MSSCPPPLQPQIVNIEDVTPIRTWPVDDVACYRTEPESEDEHGMAARLLEEGADWILFTSASTVENFQGRFDLPELVRKFPGLRSASIGPETSKALRKLNVEPALEADPHTLEGMVDAVEQAVSQPRSK